MLYKKSTYILKKNMLILLSLNPFKWTIKCLFHTWNDRSESKKIYLCKTNWINRHHLRSWSIALSPVIKIVVGNLQHLLLSHHKVFCCSTLKQFMSLFLLILILVNVGIRRYIFLGNFFYTPLKYFAVFVTSRRLTFDFFSVCRIS